MARKMKITKNDRRPSKASNNSCSNSTKIGTKHTCFPAELGSDVLGHCQLVRIGLLRELLGTEWPATLQSLLALDRRDPRLPVILELVGLGVLSELEVVQ